MIFEAKTLCRHRTCIFASVSFSRVSKQCRIKGYIHGIWILLHDAYNLVSSHKIFRLLLTLAAVEFSIVNKTLTTFCNHHKSLHDRKYGCWDYFQQIMGFNHIFRHKFPNMILTNFDFASVNFCLSSIKRQSNKRESSLKFLVWRSCLPAHHNILFSISKIHNQKHFRVQFCKCKKFKRWPLH